MYWLVLISIAAVQGERPIILSASPTDLGHCMAEASQRNKPIYDEAIKWGNQVEKKYACLKLVYDT